MPTAAKLSARRRRLKTTNRSARSPVTGRDPKRPSGNSRARGFSDCLRSEPRITAMIDREQVLHVARLARLALTDDEVERMSSELSTILEHVERISELGLEGVEPTSHVVELENVLRPDEPRPSWE